MKYNTPHDFYLEVNNKSIGGGQCGHLFNFFNAEMLNGVQILCTDSGYVKDLWNQKETNGILNHYDIVPVNNMQDGDWVIYGECSFAPLSHVAMFRKDNGDGTGIFLQQNDSRHNPATSTAQDNNPYEGIIGVFRLKQWNIPVVVETPTETPQEQSNKLHLPADAERWRIYPLDKTPVIGNEKGFLLPSKFGGLTYDILGWQMDNVAIIETRDFGKVQIYVAPETGATIK